MKTELIGELKKVYLCELKIAGNQKNTGSPCGHVQDRSSFIQFSNFNPANYVTLNLQGGQFVGSIPEKFVVINGNTIGHTIADIGNDQIKYKRQWKTQKHLVHTQVL